MNETGFLPGACDAGDGHTSSRDARLDALAAEAYDTSKSRKGLEMVAKRLGPEVLSTIIAIWHEFMTHPESWRLKVTFREVAAVYGWRMHVARWLASAGAFAFPLTALAYMAFSSMPHGSVWRVGAAGLYLLLAATCLLSIASFLVLSRKLRELHGEVAARFRQLAAARGAELSRCSASAVTPGPYRHYKGGRYTVLGVATHSETGERLVCYCTAGGELYARPLEMFLETVVIDGQAVPRFCRCEQGDANG